MTRAIGLVVCAAGGLLGVRPGFVEPALRRGWRVAVTATPTAAGWLADAGESARIEQATGLPVRHLPRGPDEPSPHPPVVGYAVAPATANTVAKLALGIADNQALTAVGEALGVASTPVVVFPRINAAHARHPAWAGHLSVLRAAGAEVVDGDLWTLHEPGSAPPDRDLPWTAVLDRLERLVP